MVDIEKGKQQQILPTKGIPGETQIPLIKPSKLAQAGDEKRNEQVPLKGSLEEEVKAMISLAREQIAQIALLGRTLKDIASALPKNAPMPVKDGVKVALELIGGIKSVGQALRSKGEGLCPESEAANRELATPVRRIVEPVPGQKGEKMGCFYHP